MTEEHTPSTSETTAPPAEDHHSDTTVVLGRQITVPGGIYTVVFMALAVFTLLEVFLFEIGNNAQWTIPLMLVLAAAKATLVVLFYMHLRTDSRIFALTLLAPLGVAILTVLYLMSVPVGGY